MPRKSDITPVPGATLPVSDARRRPGTKAKKRRTSPAQAQDIRRPPPMRGGGRPPRFPGRQGGR